MALLGADAVGPAGRAENAGRSCWLWSVPTPRPMPAGCQVVPLPDGNGSRAEPREGLAAPTRSRQRAGTDVPLASLH